MTAKNSAAVAIQLKGEFADKEYRDAYVEENLATGIAHQIRVNREARNWTQTIFAERLDKKQSLVSRLEDPNYGSFTFKTLLKIARAFDCALEVRFVAYSEFLERHQDLSPVALGAKSYSQDAAEYTTQAIKAPIPQIAKITVPNFVEVSDKYSVIFDASPEATDYIRFNPEQGSGRRKLPYVALFHPSSSNAMAFGEKLSLSESKEHAI